MRLRIGQLIFPAMILLTAGCAGALPRLAEEDFLMAEPLDALAVVTVPVGVGKLDPIMAAGTQVGSIYNSFGRAKAALRSGLETRGTYRKIFYEELRKAGYETAGNETIFEARDLSKARVIIGGDIVSARVNVFESTKEDTVEYAISIVWRVFDRRSEREIFETQTKGAAKSVDFTSAEVGAFRAAFLKLLADSEFVDTLKQF